MDIPASKMTRLSRVRIVNPVLNQSPVIRRKDANRLIDKLRARWVDEGENQLLLISHGDNKKAAEVAAAGYNSNGPMSWPVGKPTTRPVRADGSCRVHLAGQVIGRLSTYEHVPQRATVDKRLRFSFCPPVAVALGQVRGIGEHARLTGEPAGLPIAAPASLERFPKVPSAAAIDTRVLNQVSRELDGDFRK